MSMKNYSEEENEIIVAYENKSLKKSRKAKQELELAKKAAYHTIVKSKQISIRLTEKEIFKLKIKAIESGLSYQSLINALIHQYIDNRIQLSL